MYVDFELQKKYYTTPLMADGKKYGSYRQYVCRKIGYQRRWCELALSELFDKLMDNDNKDFYFIENA